MQGAGLASNHVSMRRSLQRQSVDVAAGMVSWKVKAPPVGALSVQEKAEIADLGLSLDEKCAQFFNNDLFQQRAQRDSVVRGLQKGEKLQTKYANRKLSMFE